MENRISTAKDVEKKNALSMRAPEAAKTAKGILPPGNVFSDIKWKNSGLYGEGLLKKLSSMPASQRELAAMYLQHTSGNRKVQRVISQARLRIDQPGDAFEQDADRVVDAVMDTSGSEGSQKAVDIPRSNWQSRSSLEISPDVVEKISLLRRKSHELDTRTREKVSNLPTRGILLGECDKCHMKRPRLHGPSTDSASHSIPSIVDEVIRSPGQPLDVQTRAFMEPRFGQDFSRIRIHTDSKAAESAQDMNSKAYAIGKNIIFDSGKYSPNSYEGMRILEHELIHVMLEQGNENNINFWGGADHEAITSSVARDIIRDDLFAFQLSKYSSLMDIRTRRLLLTGLPFLIGFIKGEGPEHGEDGNYTNSEEGSAASQNIGLQESYLRMALKFDEEAESLKRRKEPVHKIGSVTEKAFAALGDACHIAQDRGSHGEGVKGKGHNDLRTKSGWNPDNHSDNNEGYSKAILNTRQLLNKWKMRRSVFPE